MTRRRPHRDAATVYTELAPAVLGYLRAQRVPDAEDLLGEVFVQVARDVHRVRGGDESVRRWVFTVARHRVIDEARRRARRPPLSGEPVPDIAAPPQEDTLDPALAAALDELTPDQREVVVLRFVADLSLTDVARITRRPVGAVKSLQHRALSQLSVAVSPAAPRTL